MKTVSEGDIITLAVIGGSLIAGCLTYAFGLDSFICNVFWRAFYFIPDMITDWREKNGGLDFGDYDIPGAPEPVSPDAQTALISVSVHDRQQTADKLRDERMNRAWDRFEAATGQFAVIRDEEPEPVPVVHEGQIVDPVTAVISEAPPLPRFQPVQTGSDVDDFITNLKIRTAEFNAQLAAWAQSGQPLEITAGV